MKEYKVANVGFEPRERTVTCMTFRLVSDQTLLLSDDRHYVAIMRNISYQSPNLKQSGMVNDEMMVSQDSSDQQTHII